ncbi:hypothetical protein EDF56_1011157 [Novosphingobium sp. PhB165]|uniref:hypothetical protein n=1 Tax=Novosphingobium sp. PhB165 TaxID=2485105 RepID=UPI00104B98D6|nr:hypothetical protein [Novosphingobium sp. PhB165]TCM22465.1 hypothetical protein EDF56_1011157 [Novosphingobium sp. PhB165]
MFRNVVRSLVLVAPALVLTGALTGCGQSREAELEQQLAEAKAETAKAEAANQAAARATADAAAKQAHDAELAQFYQGETTPQDAAQQPDDKPADTPPPAPDAAPAQAAAPAASGPVMNNGPFRVGVQTEPVG